MIPLDIALCLPILFGADDSAPLSVVISDAVKCIQCESSERKEQTVGNTTRGAHSNVQELIKS